MARKLFVVLALIVAAVSGLVSAEGPSAAPAYAPAQSTVAASSPTTTSAAAAPSISEAPEASTVASAPTTSAATAPSISEAPESSSFPDIASPPAPGSEAAEGPAGDFLAPASSPIADTPAEAPESAGAVLKVSAIACAAAVAGSLLI